VPDEACQASTDEDQMDSEGVSNELIREQTAVIKGDEVFKR
jgi:hypothetical protein